MANIIRIKRRATGGAAGAPSGLANAELAFNEVDSTLYIGVGVGGGGGLASSALAIGGPGALVTLTSAQTITGAKTFSGANELGGATTATTQVTSDNSTKVATTAFVKAQSYLVANQTITASGDATGSGTTALALTLAASGVTAGTYPKVTVDAKGRVTAGTVLIATDIPSLTAAKISDFDTQVRLNRLDQLAAPTAAVAMNAQKITGLADPTSAQDAATKNYVDNISVGLDPKGSCRAATTANITLSAPQTIDGVSVIAGDRVLVKDQSTGSQNGIYIVAAGAWVRSTDADISAEVTSGMFTFIEEGALNASSGWVLSTANPVTLGTTALTFVQFSGAGQITAGAGMTKTGNTLNVVAGTGITVNADDIQINAAWAGQTAITTLGTITTGTWSATVISPAKGGTGMDNGALVADRFLYTSSAGTFASGAVTGFGRSILDDIDAAAGRTTLGLGTISTQASSAVAITGGTLSGVAINTGSSFSSGSINFSTVGANGASTGAFTTLILGASGAAASNMMMQVAGVITASSGSAMGCYLGLTLTAAAINDYFYGDRIGYTVATGTFAGLRVHGQFIGNTTKTGTGTISVSYGLYVEAQTAGTVNFAAYFNGDVSATGILRLGSTPVAINDTAGKILSASLNTVQVADGGTGATTASAARTNLGATTLGANLFTLANPSAVSFLRVNADNTVTAQTAANFRTDLGLGTLASQSAGSVAITGGSIDGTTVGATTASTGAFTTLSASGASDFTNSSFASPGVASSRTRITARSLFMVDSSAAADGKTVSFFWNSGFSIQLHNDAGVATDAPYILSAAGGLSSGHTWRVANSSRMSLTSTGLNSTAIGATTPSTGAFTTVNGLTLTANATGFSAAGGTASKTLTVSNTLTLAGTDSSTLNIGAGGTLGTAAFTATTAYATAAQGTKADAVGAVNGLVKSNGAGTFSAAVDGTDYLSPSATIDGGAF